MPEFRIVQHADRSPSMCVACGANAGPFIDVDISTFSIATPTGWTPIVDGTVYLCVGTHNNPGCAVQIGRKSGLMADQVVLEEALLENEQLRAEIAELKAIGKKKTISLADAERLLVPSAEF